MGNCCSTEEEFDENEELSLRHFQLLRSVGRGAFGKVRIVQKRDDKKLYALKYINKEKCIKMKAVNNIIQERKLLEEIKNTFIVNLQFAFQDVENMFMVIDLMLGGDLRYRLDRNGPIGEECTRFYAAELSLALEYLHSERIVHRDIKPDNLLLDEHGHVHLTDFNVAVRVKPDRLLTAAAGTRAYMAPEVLMQKVERTGYFTSVDWWSLGVVIYECLFGKRPFHGKGDELTEAIKTAEIIVPPDKVSKECEDAVRRFLERDISKRLGCGVDGIRGIREHPWFAGIDWELLARKEVQPPFVPDSAKVNFDATYELEEMLLEDNPLKAKPRRRKSRVPRENESIYQEIETRFEPYSTLKPKAVPNSTSAISLTTEASREGSVDLIREDDDDLAERKESTR